MHYAAATGQLRIIHDLTRVGDAEVLKLFKDRLSERFDVKRINLLTTVCLWVRNGDSIHPSGGHRASRSLGLHA